MIVGCVSPCMTSRMGPLLPIVTVSPAFPCETGQLGLGLCVVGQKALPRHLVWVFSGPDSVACAWRNVFCPTAAVASFWLHGAGVVLIVVFVVRIGFGVVVGVGFGLLVVFGCVAVSGCVRIFSSSCALAPPSGFFVWSGWLSAQQVAPRAVRLLCGGGLLVSFPPWSGCSWWLWLCWSPSAGLSWH